MKSWNYKWFGFWCETGDGYEECPSIHDFIDDASSKDFDKERVAAYFENAQVVATTSRMGFPCAVTGERFPGSVSYRTDGEWLWLDDLGYYVREHNVCPPKEMLATLEKNDFEPPEVSESKVESLEWPPVG